MYGWPTIRVIAPSYCVSTSWMKTRKWSILGAGAISICRVRRFYSLPSVLSYLKLSSHCSDANDQMSTLIVAMRGKMNADRGARPNRRLQLTAFGARDRAFFDSFCGAPRRQLKRRTLGGAPSLPSREKGSSTNPEYLCYTRQVFELMMSGAEAKYDSPHT